MKLDEDNKVFLEEEEEKEVEVREPKRRSAELRFSRKVVERPPTYDDHPCFQDEDAGDETCFCR